MDWISATGMITGQAVPVPTALVLVPYEDRPWSVPGLRWNSNGLASGNSRDEASLHALYEIVERDGLSRQPVDAPREYIDPESITDDHCAALIALILSSGAMLSIDRVPNRFGVPCFNAEVWSHDFPVVSGGTGAHLDAHVAVSRAMTEAVQSRLTAIAGSRDDIPSIYPLVGLSVEEIVRQRQGTPKPWDELASPVAGPFDDVGVELDWLCRRVREITGAEPLVADLSTVDEFAVVKVVAPGTIMDHERVHPTP
jgi:ribosomal protein S12 methylthiotransferase accessory factor